MVELNPKHLMVKLDFKFYQTFYFVFEELFVFLHSFFTNR